MKHLEVGDQYIQLQDGDSFEEGDEYLSSIEWIKCQFLKPDTFDSMFYLPHRQLIQVPGY